MSEPEQTTQRTTLTIYLLPSRGGRYRLVSPELEEELATQARDPDPSRDGDEAPAPESGRPDGADGADGEGASGARRLLDRGVHWLKARGGATERVLKELRLPETVTVIHPAGLPGHKARRIFRRQVEESVRRHRRWLVVDGALLPASVLLSIVPGPNVLVPYLAWRTLSHWRGQRGGSRALGDTRDPEPGTTFVAEPLLDPLLDLAARRFVLRRGRRLREIGERIGIPDLDRHL